MATTRKTRARTNNGQFQGDDPATSAVNEAWKTTVAAEDLAAYIGWEGDKIKLRKAIDLSTAAIEEQLGRELPAVLPHELAQAVRLAATKLLLTDKLDQPMKAEDLPAVARYFVRLASAQG